MYKPLWFRVWLFRHDVELTAFNYGLHPELPEIKQISEQADSIVRRHNQRAALSRLSPTMGVRLHPRVSRPHIDVGPAWDGLKPWTLACYHVPMLQSRITGFVVDRYGMHVLSEVEQAEPLVTFTAASITTLEGRQFAKRIIKELTGDDIDGFDVRALERSESIAVSIERGEWKVTVHKPSHA